MRNGRKAIKKEIKRVEASIGRSTGHEKWQLEAELMQLQVTLRNYKGR